MLTENGFENGSVSIHEQVIIEIVKLTISEIPNVSSVGSFFDRIRELAGQKSRGGISVKMDANNVFLTVCISVKYGLNITEVAKTVQEKIKNAIEKVLDVNVKRVDVQIRGIERGP